MIVQNPENYLTMALLTVGLLFAIGLVGITGYAAFFSRH